jgi:glycosyltransferase involved in cell wall biosynthesis
VPDAFVRPARVRVLHVITSLGFGGAERLVVSAARKLPADRFESVICCFSGRGPLATEAEDAGVRVQSVDAFPGLTNPIAFARLARIIQTAAPAIVHTHLQSPNLYGRLAARLCRVPLIVATEHNVYEAKARRYVAVERMLAHSTDALVAVSEEVQRFLSAQIGVPASRIRVIRNGVTLPPPSPAGVAALERRVGNTAGVLRISTVASLTPKKGHAVLLHALVELRNRGVRCVALFAGEGPERARLESLATQLNLGDAVHLLGGVNNIADVLAATDIFVLPSLIEGLPLALLEAMHAGMPIVATAVGGVPEAIASGSNGLLVPSGDAAALAAAIAELEGSQERRETMGRRARESAADRFSESAYVHALAALYADLLAR